MSQQVILTATVSQHQIGRRLDKALSEIFPRHSRSSIKKWILDDCVLINKEIWNKPKKKVLGGEEIIINAHLKKKYAVQNISLDIVYEDDDILVINKPHNLVVHPGAGNPDGTVLNALLYHYPPAIKVPRAGIVHRLDKNTTGLMVVAKTVSAYTRLVELLQQHEIIREYEAITIGCVTEDGKVNKPLSRHPIKRTHMCVHPMGKPALTYYRIIKRFRTHTHLHLRLDTGRTHQIRVHMAYITHPLVGDKTYGNRFQLPKDSSEAFVSTLRAFNRPALHARTLFFRHPITNVAIKLHAPIPQDMVSLIKEMHIDYEEYGKK